MNKEEQKQKLRNLPGVDILLQEEDIQSLIKDQGRELVSYVIRTIIDEARRNILNGKESPLSDNLTAQIKEMVSLISKPSLKPVINATGVVIHTNLGRAPLGKKVLADIQDIVLGYSNLEFDLKTAYRGKRNDHLVELLKFITSAESAVVVNNNAAGLILALNTLAKDKEVIVSRGELIEIGGSFRIPEIMAASGAKMVEVGTTNKTRLADYEKAINENTAMIFKAHKSNYSILGFTEEASVKELAILSRNKGIAFLYDIGSGLLRKPENLNLYDEPDVKSSIDDGADLVAFSGDKLLGGPQAGIVVGKKELITLLSSAPMMRALRVGKLTIAALLSVIRSYFKDNTLVGNLPLFSMLESKESVLKERAKQLQEKFNSLGVDCEITESVGQCGGGTLPGLKIKSYAVKIVARDKAQNKRSLFAETIFKKLLNLDRPILGVLRKGELLFDVLTLSIEDFLYIGESVSQVLLEG